MDELFEAVQDMEFVNASTGTLKPTATFLQPDADELAEFVRRKEKDEPGFFDLSRLAESSLGLYTLSRFLKDMNDETVNNQINFLEDAVRYSKCVGANALGLKAEYINSKYVADATGAEKQNAELITYITERNLEVANSSKKEKQVSFYEGCWDMGDDNVIRFGGIFYEVS